MSFVILIKKRASGEAHFWE